MKSWKTTTAAVLGFLTLLLAQFQAVLDGNPATVANWNTVFAGAAPLIGLLFAKDDDKGGGAAA